MEYHYIDYPYFVPISIGGKTALTVLRAAPQHCALRLPALFASLTALERFL